MGSTVPIQGTDGSGERLPPFRHAAGGGTVNETDIAHRRIATQKITINAIRVLDHDQLNRLQDVLNHIAADREYYMPEQRQGMGR